MLYQLSYAHQRTLRKNVTQLRARLQPVRGGPLVQFQTVPVPRSASESARLERSHRRSGSMQVFRPIETSALRHPTLSQFSRSATASGPRCFLWFRGSASAIAKSLERVENLLAVHLRLFFTESGNMKKLTYRCGTFSAKFVQRCIMHHHISWNTLLLRRGSSPLAKIFAQFGVRFCNGGLGGGFWQVRADERNSRCNGCLGHWTLRLNSICKPVKSAAAGVARVAFFKFWVLAKMRTNLAVAAGC